jgi:hypothetical protein
MRECVELTAIARLTEQVQESLLLGKIYESVVLVNRCLQTIIRNQFA